MRQVLCNYCGTPAELVDGSYIYPHRRDLHGRKYWNCDKCSAYVGTHENSPDFAPYGRLANAELRSWKTAAHASFDQLWKHGRMSRRDAYHWASKTLKIPHNKTHIGVFDVEKCQRLISAVEEYLNDASRAQDPVRRATTTG